MSNVNAHHSYKMCMCLLAYSVYIYISISISPYFFLSIYLSIYVSFFIFFSFIHSIFLYPWIYIYRYTCVYIYIYVYIIYMYIYILYYLIHTWYTRKNQHRTLHFCAALQGPSNGFISDKQWVAWLHPNLKTFKIPRHGTIIHWCHWMMMMMMVMMMMMTMMIKIHWYHHSKHENTLYIYIYQNKNTMILEWTTAHWTTPFNSQDTASWTVSP